jgi:hypothetical protein
MSKLNQDILFLIFEELQEDSKSLFSCLMVNRLWCKTVIPILWRNPWCYNDVNYSNKNSLFIIIYCYLFDDIKKFMTEQEIQLHSDSLLFDYLSFCRSMNVNIVNSIISSLTFNQSFIQQQFYFLFMRKCPKLKYLDMRSIKYQIFYFPKARARLESLCELKCDTSTDSSYFYRLSQLCQYIQRLIINNIDPEPNDGIVKLIEVQKNLKHFEWIDDFVGYHLEKDPYKKIFLALKKKANSLNYLRINFQYVGGIENILLQEILPKLYKLKILIIDDYLFFSKKQLDKLRMMTYHELEVIKIDYNKLDIISNIIENSGRNLKKILFRPYDIADLEFSNFNKKSLNFICKVCENCFFIEYLPITFSSLECVIEFERLLKVCQNLKSILMVMLNIEENTHENYVKYGKELLKILIRSAPTNLKEIRFGDEFKFSLKNLKEFLEKWRGRSALTILTSDSIYETENYKKLINRYKRDGVIKDFKYVPYRDSINYAFNVL